MHARRRWRERTRSACLPPAWCAVPDQAWCFLRRTHTPLRAQGYMVGGRRAMATEQEKGEPTHTPWAWTHSMPAPGGRWAQTQETPLHCPPPTEHRGGVALHQKVLRPCPPQKFRLSTWRFFASCSRTAVLVWRRRALLRWDDGTGGGKARGTKKGLRRHPHKPHPEPFQTLYGRGNLFMWKKVGLR